jgi:chemotaxis protein methyltransferase CheR
VALSEQDWALLRELLRKHTGNEVHGLCSGQMEARLAEVARQTGQSTESLTARLKDGIPTQLQRMVAEAMTVKETSFFRDAASFALLRDHLMPRLIESCARKRKLRIWSAGCASGQEAYSVAMLLNEHFPQILSWDVEIMGTDISEAACGYAAQGMYGKHDMSRGITPRYRERYFVPEGEGWRVSGGVRRMVRFERRNLCMDDAGGDMFDLVLLRNVLLYFEASERRRALKHVRSQMHGHAALLLGSAEQAEDCNDTFQLQLEREGFFYLPLQRDEAGTGKRMLRGCSVASNFVQRR